MVASVTHSTDELTSTVNCHEKDFLYYALRVKRRKLFQDKYLRGIETPTAHVIVNIIAAQLHGIERK